MKTLLTILFLFLSAIALGQTSTGVDTAKYKNYTACSDCFEDWKTSNGNEAGSPARANSSNRTGRNGDVATPVKQEGKRVLGQTIAILTSAVATWIFVSMGSISIQ